MYTREIVCLLYDLLTLASFLSSKLVISRWQEAYIRDSELSLVGISPSISRAPVFRGDSARGSHMVSSKGRANIRCADAGEDENGTRPTGASANRGGGARVGDGPT
jgi:hypothetical protein